MSDEIDTYAYYKSQSRRRWYEYFLPWLYRRRMRRQAGCMAIADGSGNESSQNS